MGIFGVGFTNNGLRNRTVSINQVIYSGDFELIKIGVVNKIGRIYGHNAVLKILESFGDTGYRYGCFGVPSFNTSHVVNDLWVENDVLKTKINVLNTPSGNLLLEKINNNEYGFSTACFGNVNFDNTTEITEFVTAYAVPKEDIVYEF